MTELASDIKKQAAHRVAKLQQYWAEFEVSNPFTSGYVRETGKITAAGLAASIRSGNITPGRVFGAGLSPIMMGEVSQTVLKRAGASKASADLSYYAAIAASAGMIRKVGIRAVQRVAAPAFLATLSGTVMSGATAYFGGSKRIQEGVFWGGAAGTALLLARAGTMASPPITAALATYMLGRSAYNLYQRQQQIAAQKERYDKKETAVLENITDTEYYAAGLQKSKVGWAQALTDLAAKKIKQEQEKRIGDAIKHLTDAEMLAAVGQKTGAEAVRAVTAAAMKKVKDAAMRYDDPDNKKNPGGKFAVGSANPYYTAYEQYRTEVLNALGTAKDGASDLAGNGYDGIASAAGYATDIGSGTASAVSQGYRNLYDSFRGVTPEERAREERYRAREAARPARAPTPAESLNQGILDSASGYLSSGYNSLFGTGGGSTPLAHREREEVLIKADRDDLQAKANQQHRQNVSNVNFYRNIASAADSVLGAAAFGGKYAVSAIVAPAAAQAFGAARGYLSAGYNSLFGAAPAAKAAPETSTPPTSGTLLKTGPGSAGWSDAARAAAIAKRQANAAYAGAEKTAKKSKTKAKPAPVAKGKKPRKDAKTETKQTGKIKVVRNGKTFYRARKGQGSKK